MSKWTLRGKADGRRGEGEDGCWTTWEVTEAHEETWTETQSCGRVAKRLFYFKAEWITSHLKLFVLLKYKLFPDPRPPVCVFSSPVGMWVASKQDLCKDIEQDQRSGLRRQLCGAGRPAPPEISCSCSTRLEGQGASFCLAGSTGHRHSLMVSASTRGGVIPPKQMRVLWPGRWGRKTTDASYTHISREWYLKNEGKKQGPTFWSCAVRRKQPPKMRVQRR